MHITISPTGEIHMDINGSMPAEVAGTILSIQRELRQQAVAEQAAAEAQAAEAPRPASLNDAQGETYDWLVQNDHEQGLHITAIARAFGISKEAASHRMGRLTAMGFARRVGGGKYRANTE